MVAITWHDSIEKPIKAKYSIGDEFTIDDIYALEQDLAEQYPKNNHIRATIRDVLQDLRDEGFIAFEGERGEPEAGRYKRIA